MERRIKYLYDILQSANVKKIKITSNGFTGCCPFHDDKDPSFSMNKEGLWICFACGAKGNLKKFLELTKLKFDDYKTILEELKIMFDTKEEKVRTKKILDFEYIPYKDKVPEYLLNRLELKTIKHFELGYMENNEAYNNYTIIPIKFEGKNVGFQARYNGDDPNYKRYLNPPGFNIKNYIFNYDKMKEFKEILVTEGVFSVMSMHEKMIENSCAIFGASVSLEQIKLLLKLNLACIHLCLDNDAAGLKCALELGTKLEDFVKVRVMILPEGKDPNDLTRKEIYLIFRDALDFSEFKSRYEKNQIVSL
ncbi:MAG: CHC2 zinc finger domain-containing protein [Candidatus Aenigmatarchaeota archaeon]